MHCFPERYAEQVSPPAFGQHTRREARLPEAGAPSDPAAGFSCEESTNPDARIGRGLFHGR